MILPRSVQPFRVRGAPLEPMSLTLLRSGVEYEVISPAGGETLEIYVPDDQMVEHGLARWLEPDVLNVRPSAAYATALFEHLSPLVMPGRPLAQAPESARARILEVLGAAFDSVDPSAPPVPTVRLHATYRRAIALIDEKHDLILSVATLARRLGVTTRTLRYASGYALGIYQYLLRRRLTIARDALLDPDRSSGGVLEILLVLGISHQGEFAGQYRRLFGETLLRPGSAHYGDQANECAPQGGLTLDRTEPSAACCPCRVGTS